MGSWTWVNLIVYGLEEGLKEGNAFFLEGEEQALDHESHLSDF